MTKKRSNQLALPGVGRRGRAKVARVVRKKARVKTERKSIALTKRERSMPIADIKLGTRHRKDMGDIVGLAASIADVGLLHPIVVKPDGTLIVGARRIEAFKALQRTEIPVTVVDIDELVFGERAENIDRKDFTIEEQVAIGREIERLLGKRQGQRTDKGVLPQNFGEVKGKETADIAAKKAGFRNAETYRQAGQVVDAAKANPKKHSKPLADMNRTGRVNGPYKRVKVATQAAAIRAEPPPYPNLGPYRVIVADVPWAYEIRKEDSSHRAVHAYPTMSIEQICAEAEKVRAIAHDDCILWFWVTNHHMRESFQVLDAWGFAQKTILTWVKDRMGTGDWLRGQSEHCLMAVRGKPIVELTNETTILHGKMREASRKPAEFFPFVEKLCPAPRYAYLFAREARDRWDCHGDEVGKFTADAAVPALALAV